MPQVDELSETAQVLIGLEDMVTSTDRYKQQPRGRCTMCQLEVQLTPKGYLKSHSYIQRRDEPKQLFSWRASLTGDKQGAIVRCAGGGQRPGRRHATS